MVVIVIIFTRYIYFKTRGEILRREYINYPFDLPIKIAYLNIKNYPTHWHNSIEIIYVLKGSLHIKIDTDSFTLKEREVEIINSDESHEIQGIDDNKVLIFNIDPFFFEKYYKDINNISIDIMYSLPGQTMESLKKTVKDALSLKVPHLSLYSLTVEENSVFGKKGYKSLDEDTEADMYEYIVDTLVKYGYHQYEIANFCLPGYESKHNLGYWHYDDYLALGPGSTSKYNHQRIEKTNNIKTYLNNYELIENIEILSNEDEAFENLMMSLRLEEGLNISVFKDKYGFNPLDYYSEAIKKNSNYLKVNDNHLICTDREILNHILVDFLG